MAENKVQKIGFSHLIPDPVVRNVDTHHSESESFRNFHDDQDPQFLKIIEREIYELTIKEAKIEGLQEATDSDNNDDEQEQVEKYEFGGESGGSIFEDEVENEENVRGYFGDLGKQRNGSRKWSRYPMRPAAEDCAFYMKTGSCKFGSSCKFNHPPRRNNPVAKEWTTWREESSGSVALGECKYYITSGGCKYGKDCKYSHGLEKNLTSQSQELNFLGLPIRPGEKECPYYMRTGSCKYGSTCRFHHPDPSTVSGGDIPSQHVSSSTGSSSWSFPREIREASPYVPAPPNQSSTASSPNWNGYQAGTYQTSGGGLPVPPAFSVPAGIKFGAPQHPHNSLVDEYPERPGQPECNYFLKTGDCKFKSSCKFHHPKARLSHPTAGFSTLNDKGLPLRPDQPMCTFYHRYGICKYGPSCKYDHPSSYSPPPPFG